MDFKKLDNKIKELTQEQLEEEYIEANKQPLYEFADLVPEDTNLCCVIWVDGPRNISHAKRIKFQNNTANKLNGGELIPITISDNPQIPDSVKSKLKINNQELTKIKQWIILNKQILLNYADGKITTKQLYQQLKAL